MVIIGKLVNYNTVNGNRTVIGYMNSSDNFNIIIRHFYLCVLSCLSRAFTALL